MFGKRLRELRDKQHLSMDKLIELYNKKYDAKMNKSTLSRYENGLQDPIYTVVVNLADFFNVSVDYISGNDDIPTPVFENIISDGQQLLNKYNQLNDLGKEKTNEYVDDLLANERYTTSTTVSKPKEVRYVGKKDGIVKVAAYGGGVKTNKKKIKHT